MTGTWEPAELLRLLEQGSDALSLHDENGLFQYASPAFERLLGVSPAELVGTNPYELMHPEDVDEVVAVHQGLMWREEVEPVQYRLRRTDGTYVWVEGTARRVEADHLLVVQVRALRARRSLLQALEHERAVAGRLHELQTQQRRFLTTIAHRARHPMTAVIGFSSLLEQLLPPDADDRLRRVIARLEANVDELAGLIQDVTDIEGLARRALQVRGQIVDLRQLADAAVRETASPDSVVTNDVPPGSLVFADPTLLSRALQALLSNAVLHTPVGTPCSLWTERTPDGQLVGVDDAGPGIPDPLKDAIWEPFRHGEDEPIDPGMGLGLYVTAEVAAAHGGRAWVEDRPGGGASFRLLLPYGPGDVAAG